MQDLLLAAAFADCQKDETRAALAFAFPDHLVMVLDDELYFTKPIEMVVYGVTDSFGA